MNWSELFQASADQQQKFLAENAALDQRFNNLMGVPDNDTQSAGNSKAVEKPVKKG